MRNVVYDSSGRLRTALAWFVVVSLTAGVEASQRSSHRSGNHAEPTGPADHEAQEQPSDSSSWQFMHDGVTFLTFNHQGSPRGDTQLTSQNWWMGMGRRAFGSSMLIVTGMLSLEPATVGSKGYSEIFQTGEVFQGRPIVDRQHPHDFVMQLAAAWRTPLSSRTGLTLAGGPVGEATLGPVAFMHRPSAADNPFAPLGHHTFDSTHIAKGVIAAMVDHGPWAFEGSAFHGREPDEDRWNLSDVGGLDSWAARVWLRPTEAWALQLSHGFLKEPEELEPGNIRRTTASASWMTQRGPDFVAITVAYGRNDKDHTDTVFDALFTEGTYRFGPNAVYGRFEAVDVETELLLGEHEAEGNGRELRDTVIALTIGGVRDFPRIAGFELGLGADVTFHRAPERLEPTHGSTPVSFKIFLRVRPPAPPMGRMWNMTMARPMAR